MYFIIKQSYLKIDTEYIRVQEYILKNSTEIMYKHISRTLRICLQRITSSISSTYLKLKFL